MSSHWANICNWRHHLVNSNTLPFFEMHLSFVQAKLKRSGGCLMGTTTPCITFQVLAVAISTHPLGKQQRVWFSIGPGGHLFWKYPPELCYHSSFTAQIMEL